MKHTDLEPEQRQQPLGPAEPRPVKEKPEWVPHATGVERNTQTDRLRTVDKPAPIPPSRISVYVSNHAAWCQLLLDLGGGEGWTPVNLPLLKSHPEWCQLLLDFGQAPD